MSPVAQQLTQGPAVTVLVVLAPALSCGFSQGDPGWGRRRGGWLGGNVMAWGGRAALLATSPPAHCGMRGRELYHSFSTSPWPRSIRVLPQMPHCGQVSASACPQEARPSAFTSVVFISVFSLSHCAEPRVWGGLFFINPISLVIQITLPFLLKVAGVRAWRTQSPSLNSNQIRSTRVAKAQRGGEEVARKGLRA